MENKLPVDAYHHYEFVRFINAPESHKINKADVFVNHIKNHLKPDQKVICKICGKDIDTIYEEDKRV